MTKDKPMATPCIDHGGKKPKYATCFWQGGYTMKHRKAYCQANGLSISDIAGKVVRHTCDNPRCINPDHLEIGDQSDNMQDCVQRGRHANNLRNFDHTNRRRGEDNPAAKLTAEDVADIRAKWSSGWTQTEIARQYGVRQAHISRIVNNKIWRNQA